MSLVIVKNWLPTVHMFLSTGEVKGGMCSHYRKSFYEVPTFIRVDDNDLQTVKGTTTFHSVRNTSIPGTIEVRENLVVSVQTLFSGCSWGMQEQASGEAVQMGKQCVRIMIMFLLKYWKTNCGDNYHVSQIQVR